MKFQLFQKFQSLTKNFEELDSEIIVKNPEILKVLRLSLGMSVHQFEKTFAMHQQSRYERGLYHPTKPKISEFLEKFEKYKKNCNFQFEYLSEMDRQFLEKRKAGAKVGIKTLFQKNDPRTAFFSRKGAQLGGLKTISKYGKQHMILLAKQIQRGREQNKGYRSRAEMLVAEVLKELNLRFEYEKPVNGFLPDFQLTENRLLEVMCFATEDYWKKQWRKIEKLTEDYEILIITNKPEVFGSLRNDKIKILKFSKSLNVLRSRLKSVL